MGINGREDHFIAYSGRLKQSEDTFDLFMDVVLGLDCVQFKVFNENTIYRLYNCLWM